MEILCGKDVIRASWLSREGRHIRAPFEGVSALALQYRTANIDAASQRVATLAGPGGGCRR
jgi:hypothetical protein